MQACFISGAAPSLYKSYRGWWGGAKAAVDVVQRTLSTVETKVGTFRYVYDQQQKLK